MSGSLLDKYTKRPEPSGDDALASDAEGAEDLGCFGFLRGVRDRAVMLEIIKKDGTVLAVGYAWLERILLDPSGTITLFIAGQKITISGTNLHREVRPRVSLFNALARHRVPWVREARAIELVDNDTTVIDTMSW